LHLEQKKVEKGRGTPVLMLFSAILTQHRRIPHMVKSQKNNTTKSAVNKEKNESYFEARKINASTPCETCSESLSSFGGLASLIKFFDIVGFEEVIGGSYVKPSRPVQLGDYKMLIGVIILLFIGFNRVAHFFYIRRDCFLCRYFKVEKLPVVSTFWRYINSLGINQGQSLLRVMAVLRERVWHYCGICYGGINIDIDTTAETVYGDQQGGRSCYNTEKRGAKAYRPVVAFIEQTREYIAGKLRSGKTMSGDEVSKFIMLIKDSLPGCVKRVFVRADCEFFSWEAVKELTKDDGFDFTIATSNCRPPFAEGNWYPDKHDKANISYNECIYTPTGWEKEFRFVVMRILNKPKRVGKCSIEELFEDARYTYRIFCTTRSAKPHKVIEEYDKRADVENLVGEAKREGLSAIPSGKFKNNYAWFQIVMLSYNIWRYIKILAQQCIAKEKGDTLQQIDTLGLGGIQDNTVRIARLKLLFIAAKIVFHDNHTTVRYSIQDTRTPGLLKLLGYMDELRKKPKKWLTGTWLCRFSFNKA
jgi:hypothetical protein